MAREPLHRPHRNDPATGMNNEDDKPSAAEAERLRKASEALASLCPLCTGAMRAVAQSEGERRGLLACASCGFTFET